MTGPFGMSELFWFHVVVQLGVGLVVILKWVVILKVAPKAIAQLAEEVDVDA